MFEQMVKQMYVPPEILVQLTDEQRDVLHYEIRQEQIRRYNNWEKALDESGGTPKFKRKSKLHKKKKEKRVTFSEGPDGQVKVNKVYMNNDHDFKENGYVSDTVIVTQDRKSNGSLLSNQIAYNNHNRMYIPDKSNDTSSWIQKRDPPNGTLAVKAATKPVSIVRIIDGYDVQTTRAATSSPLFNGLRNRKLSQSHEDLSSGQQKTHSIRIIPRNKTEPLPTDLVLNADSLFKQRTSTLTTHLQKPPKVDYVREISISPGFTSESPTIRKKIENSRPSTPYYDSMSRIGPDRPQEITRQSPVSVTFRSISPTDIDDLMFHRTIRVNGDSYVSYHELNGDSESTESDIQPPVRLQRFPRFTLQDNVNGEANIEQIPSSQLTPSMPRRTYTSQTFQLKRPPTPNGYEPNYTDPGSPSTQPKPAETPVSNPPAIEKSSPAQNSSTLDQTVTLKHKVAPQIQSLMEQLFGTPIQSAANVSPSSYPSQESIWFHKSEAANLMREFGMPATGYDSTFPRDAFPQVPRWFHGAIDRTRAEQLIRQVNLDGAFLVRVDPSVQRYVISVLWAGKCSHILVSVITPDPLAGHLETSYQLFAQTNADQFSSLRELVQFYATHPLTPQDQQQLLYAVGQPANSTEPPDYVDLFYPTSRMDRQTRF